MSHQFAEFMFTNGVKAAQADYGSRDRMERFASIAGPNDELSEREADFIAQRERLEAARQVLLFVESNDGAGNLHCRYSSLGEAADERTLALA